MQQQILGKCTVQCISSGCAV